MGGGGSTYDYGFRIYNAQLGKFLSVDPLTYDFPWWTPYQFAGNTPIMAIDLDGLEILIGSSMALPMEPILTLPRVGPITIPMRLLPPTEIVLPPIVPNLPNDLTVGQPKVEASEDIDWHLPPSSPSDLGSNWEEITSPENKSGNNREFRNRNKPEEIIRFDKVY